MKVIILGGTAAQAEAVKAQLGDHLNKVSSVVTLTTKNWKELPSNLSEYDRVFVATSINLETTTTLRKDNDLRYYNGSTWVKIPKHSAE